MRYFILAVCCALAACSPDSRVEKMPSVGQIFTVNRGGEFLCPTREQLFDLVKAAKSKNSSAFLFLMLPNGTCMQIPPGSEWEVEKIDNVSRFVGIRLASALNGGVVWTLPQFVTFTPGPSASAAK